MTALPTKPKHISPVCDECGTKLVLVDVFEEPSDMSPEFMWLDEWTCPNEACSAHRLIVMDWPKGRRRAPGEGTDEAIPHADVLKELETE